jgi:hypothetical protein
LTPRLLVPCAGTLFNVFDGAVGGTDILTFVLFVGHIQNGRYGIDLIAEANA